jgi:hypothetical protein
MANSVLPDPAGPQTNVGRPRGTPPSVTWSNPLIPVGVLANRGRDRPAEADGGLHGDPTFDTQYLSQPDSERRPGLSLSGRREDRTVGRPCRIRFQRTMTAQRVQSVTVGNLYRNDHRQT